METRLPITALRAVVSRYDTQKAAALALGIRQQHLSDLLHGRRTFSEAMLAKLGLTRVIQRAAR